MSTCWGGLFFPEGELPTVLSLRVYIGLEPALAKRVAPQFPKLVGKRRTCLEDCLPFSFVVLWGKNQASSLLQVVRGFLVWVVRYFLDSMQPVQLPAVFFQGSYSPPAWGRPVLVALQHAGLPHQYLCTGEWGKCIPGRYGVRAMKC